MRMPELRTIEVSGMRLRCAVEGDGPLVVMVHGFPESWYSWRHQIGPIARAGFTACAIDVRGYGGSDKPWPVADYALEPITTDVAGLIDTLRPGEKAVLIGHDWGAPIVWTTALTRPDRVAAVCGLSVPYTGVPKISFRAIIEALYTGKNRFFYQHYFQEEGRAERDLEADLRDFLIKFLYAISGDAPDGTWPAGKTADADLLEGMRAPQALPAWLTAEDLAYYAAEFGRSGLRGPLNRYRNHDRDFAWLQQFAGRRIEQPALFVGGTKDPVLSMTGPVDLIAVMRGELADLRGAHLLEGCGHWTQQERPAEVTALILDWLHSLPA